MSRTDLPSINYANMLTFLLSIYSIYILHINISVTELTTFPFLTHTNVSVT